MQLYDSNDCDTFQLHYIYKITISECKLYSKPARVQADYVNDFNHLMILQLMIKLLLPY